MLYYYIISYYFTLIYIYQTYIHMAIFYYTIVLYHISHICTAITRVSMFTCQRTSIVFANHAVHPRQNLLRGLGQCQFRRGNHLNREKSSENMGKSWESMGKLMVNQWILGIADFQPKPFLLVSVNVLHTQIPPCRCQSREPEGCILSRADSFPFAL